LKSSFLITVFLFVTSFAADSNKTRPIQLLNWWEYLAKDAVTALASQGHHLNVITYKSNEVAVSQLINNKKNIDVVIVSSQLIPSLLKDKVIYSGLFQNKNQQTEYYDFFHSTLDHCVPYLWSTTVFVMNTQKSNLQVPTNIVQLRQLKKQKLTIATIDDKFEILARLQAENHQTCPINKGGYSFPNCDFKYLKNISLGLLPSEFTTSIADIVKNENTAAYGWHGETAPFLDKKTLAISLPQGPPVIGFDAICIVNNKQTPARLRQLINFAQTLGGRKFTQYNVKQTQYFSPYKADTENLHPKIAELLNSLNLRVDELPAILIYAPNSDLHRKINIWWKNVRYGK